MEATNISIKQASSVSINIETLQATLQDAWQSIKRYCNVGALKANIQRGLQAIKQRVLAATKQATKVCCNVGAAAWMKVRTIDVQDVLSDLWIGGWSVACFYLIYMYA